MQNYLQDLIFRMTMHEKGVNSEDSISWQAHREAELLKDFALLLDIYAYLAVRRSKAERSAAYFMLGAIGKNLNVSSCAKVLISQIPAEMEKYALAKLLASLAKVPIDVDVELKQVYGLLHDSRWLIRHSAIESLAGSTAPESENQLLAVLLGSSDPYDMTYCHSVLNRIGTVKSIPALQSALKSRKRDVKLSAETAIQAITSRAVAVRLQDAAQSPRE